MAESFITTAKTPAHWMQRLVRGLLQRTFVCKALYFLQCMGARGVFRLVQLRLAGNERGNLSSWCRTAIVAVVRPSGAGLEFRKIQDNMLRSCHARRFSDIAKGRACQINTFWRWFNSQAEHPHLRHRKQYRHGSFLTDFYVCRAWW